MHAYANSEGKYGESLTSPTNGEIAMLKPRKKRHEVVQPQDPSYRLIPLIQGQNAFIDVEDLELLVLTLA